LKRLSLGLIFFLTTSLCFAQDWAASYQQSVDFYNNYQSAEARLAAERALEQIKSTETKASKNQTVILRQLSIVCYDLGEDAAALSYAKEEVEVLIALGENRDMNYANALQNLAVIRMARSEYGAADPLLSEALDLTLEYNSEDSYEVAAAKGNLAIAKFQLKEDEAARTLFESSQRVMNTYEEVGPEYFNIIYNYGSLLSENGEYEKALALFLELVDYYNEGTPNFEYGSMLIKVGDALDQLGRFSEAVSQYELAIENFTNLGEQNSEEYSIALNNLTIDLQKTGQFGRATELIEELVLQKEVEQETNPASYASTLTNYSNLLIRNGELATAKEKLELVMELYTSQLPGDLTYVNALESLSGLLLTDGDITGATQKIDLALEVAREKGMKSRLYALYNQKAKILTSEAKYTEARNIAEEALQESITLFGSDALQTAFVKNTLAGVYTQLGAYQQAGKLYLEVLPTFRQTYGESHPEYATVAANYSSLLQLEGSYYTAEYYLKIAEEIKRQAYGKENRDYLTTYENLGLLYLNTARYTEAGQVLSEIKSIKEKILPTRDPSLAYTLANLGTVKKQLAEYGDAEKYLKEARSIYETSYGTQHIFYASVINNLALLYQKMGNLDAAKPLFEQSLETYQTQIGKMNPEYATALENLATLYQMEEDYDRAKALLEEVLVIDEAILGTNHPLYSKTLHNLASIYKENEEYDQAKTLYQKALDIDEKVFGTNHPSYASTLYNLATLEQELEHYDQALTYYQQVVDIRLSILGPNHPDYAYSLYGLASIKHKTGDFEGARPLYLRVTERYLDFINQYFPALSESEKSAFYGKIKPVFDSYLDYAVEFCLLNKGTQSDQDTLIGSMYNLQLSTKALLLNATNKVRNTILSSGDTDLIALFNDWVGLKENIVKAYSMSKEELELSNIKIADMEAESNEKEKQLSLKSSSFAGAFETEAPTWNRIQEQLSSDEAAIEMIRIKKKIKQDSVLYIGLILRSTEGAIPELVVSTNGLQMEDKGFKTYKNSIIYKIQDERSYATFWKPFDDKIDSSVKRVFLSADGVINKVNIATLYNPEKKEYLIDRYKVRLLSNTRELMEMTSPEGTKNDAVMFGFPKYYISSQAKNNSGGLLSPKDMERSFGSTISELPGTLKEIEEIGQIVETSSWTFESFLAEAATEDQIKKISSPKILHIATHGFFLEDIKVDDEAGGLTSRNAKFNPLLRSGLLLAGAQNTVKNEDLPGEEDGILTAYEVMNLNLDNTQLVVMSACETGLGEVKNGEGVYGLQRSFIVAGADNLVMSLWKVNDQTTQLLMSAFYRNWFGGQTKLEAFNAAIAEVRKEFKEPYYWGAFVMLGK